MESARSEFRRGRLLVGVKSPPIHCIPAQLKKPRIAITAFWGLHILKSKCQRREGKHYFWKTMHFCNENAQNQADYCLLSTRRKPTKYMLLSNFPPKRCVRRHQPGSLTTEPPRITRKPSGFFTSYTGLTWS